MTTSARPSGVVLVNLGTPDAPTLPAVQRFLREFLTDRRIVDLSPVVWRPILETAVMHGHAKRSAAKYAAVWTPEGSPLLVHTRAQAEALAAALGAQAAEPGAPVAPGPLTVTYAMRYGRPALATALAGLQAAGVTRLLVVPLYPQYSTTTAGTIFDQVGRCLAQVHDHPELRWLRGWTDDPGYIDACAGVIERHWAEAGRPDFDRGDRLLLSYHGIPAAVAAAGDPYPAECELATDLLRARLGLSPEQCVMAYQSKFGKAEWLTPATIDTVTKLAELRTGRLDVFCPGFAADCLESLEEIAQLNGDAFLAKGGREFHAIPCLNADPAWIRALSHLVSAATAGW
jgi:ferrochelatase